MKKLINLFYATVTTLIAAFVLLYISTAAHADGTMYMHYYVNANTEDLDKIKGLSLGYQSDLAMLYTRVEGGMIYDLRDDARHPCGFAQASIGVEPQAWGTLYVHFFQGVGVVGPADSYNSGLFQFFEDAGMGFRDKRNGTSVGMSYKHISNAGLSGSNRGRDLLGVQVTIPLF